MPVPSLSASLLSLSLLACTPPCPQGPTTTCWCPGDAVGESTCGDDSLYGPCVCPGSAGLTQASPVPTLTAPPVQPPAPRSPMMPSPIPLGVDPPSAPQPLRDDAIAAWIAGPLRGHDNRSAAMRTVEITSAAGSYRIYVQNQFGFRCDLDFDSVGNPSLMLGCRSREPDWSAEPESIVVTCEDRGADVRCSAPYELHTRGGYLSREIFVFSRRY